MAGEPCCLASKELHACNLEWVNTRGEVQRNSKWSDAIGREKNIGSKDFTLGSEYKVWKDKVPLPCHHFLAKSWWYWLKKICLKNPIFKLEPNASPISNSKGRSIKGCLWTTSFFDQTLGNVHKILNYVMSIFPYICNSKLSIHQLKHVTLCGQSP